MDHNMNWMTCKLEAELFPKCLALGLLSQLEDGSWSRDCWALSHRASYPPCRQRTPLSGMPSDLSDLCVHLSKLLGPGHYWSLTLFCILVTAEPEGQPERERQTEAAPSPQKNGNLWLIKVFVVSDYLTEQTEQRMPPKRPIILNA